MDEMDEILELLRKAHVEIQSIPEHENAEIEAHIQLAFDAILDAMVVARNAITES